MRGEHEVAGRLLDEANTILHELGGLNAGVSHLEAHARLLAGRPSSPRRSLRADLATLRAMDAGNVLATSIAMLAQAVYAQGRVTEAGELCRTIDAHAVEDDATTRAIWHGVHAKVLAHEGRTDEAEALAAPGDRAPRADRFALTSGRCDARPCRRAGDIRPRR